MTWREILFDSLNEIDRLNAKLEAKDATPEPTVGSDRLREIAKWTWPESCAAKGHVLQMVDEFDRLTAENKTVKRLLRAAKCPNCNSEGAYYDNYGNVCQCQWCYEVEQALKGES